VDLANVQSATLVAGACEETAEYLGSNGKVFEYELRVHRAILRVSKSGHRFSLQLLLPKAERYLTRKEFYHVNVTLRATGTGTIIPTL